MLIKTLLLLAFITIIFNLFTGLFWLVKDQGSSNRTLQALAFRIALTLALIAFIFYGFYSGNLALRTPFPQPL